MTDVIRNFLVHRNRRNEREQSLQKKKAIWKNRSVEW